eukprot:TRINITY_DN4278_c0_g1_i4.p1 TRINITY_DN4278_c0_g1~~TRINITY_DN4278_c0_g1_i4.p1  ORF type:complete len:206 (-),score=44.87 TRINITY_DN4278_c0_g1_i4:108-725(-)
MNFVYAVEYVEVGESTDSSECSIGNALLSKFPLKNLQQQRFSSQCCRYSGRYGGRVAVSADLDLGNGKTIHVTSTHLESGQSDLKDILESLVVRGKQAYEIVTNLPRDSLAIPHIVGGDFNAPFHGMSPANAVLDLYGFSDAHSSLSWSKRCTCPDDPLSNYDLCTLDYLFSKPNNFSSPGLCQPDDVTCRGFSDHVPIWATYHV